MKLTEHEFSLIFEDYLKRKGIEFRRNKPVPKGTPDYTIVIKHRYIYIELKTDSGKLNVNQKRYYTKRIKEEYDYNFYVLRPKNWQEFKYYVECETKGIYDLSWFLSQC